MERELTTCPQCGASNSPNAAWCGQCYAQFSSSSRRRRRSRGWYCRVCGEINKAPAASCETCGTAIYESFTEPRERVSPTEALRASVIPGMGLLRVGHSVEGVLSAVLAVFSLGAGIAVVTADNAGGWVLVGIGLAIWAAAARDAVRLARGDGEAWMGPRTLSIVAAVVVITASILVLRTPLGGAG